MGRDLQPKKQNRKHDDIKFLLKRDVQITSLWFCVAVIPQWIPNQTRVRKEGENDPPYVPFYDRKGVTKLINQSRTCANTLKEKKTDGGWLRKATNKQKVPLSFFLCLCVFLSTVSLLFLSGQPAFLINANGSVGLLTKVKCALKKSR